MEIFPETVANSIFTNLYSSGGGIVYFRKTKKILREPLRLLNLYKERLRLLENKDNKLGLCMGHCK